MKDILVKLRGSGQTIKRIDYLEAKYDSMTSELHQMETKVVEEEEEIQQKLISMVREEKSDNRSLRKTESKSENGSSSEFQHFPYRTERMEDERKISSSSDGSTFSFVPKVKILFDVPAE
jgi:TolA-binding protein